MTIALEPLIDKFVTEFSSNVKGSPSNKAVLIRECKSSMLRFLCYMHAWNLTIETINGFDKKFFSAQMLANGYSSDWAIRTNTYVGHFFKFLDRDGLIPSKLTRKQNFRKVHSLDNPLVNEFLRDQKQKVAQGTIRDSNYHVSVKLFYKYQVFIDATSKSITDISFSTQDDFKKFLVEEGYSCYSITPLRLFYDFLKLKGIVDFNPFFNLRRGGWNPVRHAPGCEHVDKYIASLNHLTENAITKITISLNHFKLFCQETKTNTLKPNEAAPKNLRDYLKNHDYSHSSASRALRHVKGFYDFLLLSGLVSINYFNVGKKNKGMGYASIEEMRDACDGGRGRAQSTLRDWAIVICLYGTGLRLAEVQNLRIEDLSILRKTLRVTVTKYPREIPIPDGCIDLLNDYINVRKSWLPDCKLLFATKNGKKLCTAQIYNIVNFFLRGIEADGKGAETIRRSYAKHLLSAGAGIVDVKMLLGFMHIPAVLRHAPVAFFDLKKIHNEIIEM